MSEQSSQSKSQPHSSRTAAVATPTDSGPGATEHEKTGCLALALGLLAVGAIAVATTIVAHFIVRGI